LLGPTISDRRNAKRRFREKALRRQWRRDQEECMSERIAVVGLGYVGLPLALALAEKYDTVGFDIDARRIEELRTGHDWAGEYSREKLTASRLQYTSDPAALQGRTFFIVCVPTPIDGEKRPDLRPLEGASTLVGKALSKGAVVVYESTVYPGATEEFCGPILEMLSGLRRGPDFKLGYSPERINPGDTEHTLERIIKVVSGEDAQTLDRVDAVYASVISAGIYRAPNIKVAEAAKVLENTQRDLNIALMNELAIICDRVGIRTRDVLDAAGTKWNFLKFTPGLVGGHCVGVDPYYLTSRAAALGYHPEVILAGRRINDNMGNYIAERVVRHLGQSGVALRGARVAIFGITFKEDVRDIRNSRVPDIVTALRGFGVIAMICDPEAEESHVQHEYGLSLDPMERARDLDALILASPHRAFLSKPQDLYARVRQGGLVFDIKAALDPGAAPRNLILKSL
jgi:UDP-N-acetyl-D-galactosamine dehydrogenase